MGAEQEASLDAEVHTIAVNMLEGARLYDATRLDMQLRGAATQDMETGGIASIQGTQESTEPSDS